MKSNSQIKLELNQFEAEFTDISKDNNLSMYICNRKAINFDKVKESINNQLDSCDALMINSRQIVFVEFKNGTLERTKIPQSPEEADYIKLFNKDQKRYLYLKITESLLLFEELSDCSFQDLSQNISYILVYNKEKNPQTQVHKHLSKLSGNQSWLSISSRYASKFLKSVQLMNVEEFNQFVENF